MIPAFLLAMAAVSGAADSLYGTVRAVGSGEVISGVQVSVRGRLETAFSDPAGHYVLRDVAGGHVDLRFERLGFQPLLIRVMMGGQGAAQVDVDLVTVPVHLPPVTTYPMDGTQPESPRDRGEIGRMQLTQASAGRDPLVGDEDVFGAAETVPSGTSREELNPSPQFRGGAGSENLVLLDGLPWRGPRPMGGIAGLLPSTAMASVDLHTATPPARYGGALSSTIVIQPVSVDRIASMGTIDPSIVETTVGSPLPLPGSTVLVSGQGTFLPVFGNPDGAGENDNGFIHAFGRLSLPVGSGRLDLYYLDGRDQLGFPATTKPSGPRNGFTSVGSLAGAVWAREFGAGRALQARLWSSHLGSHGTWTTWRLASRLRDIGGMAEYAAGGTEFGLTLSSIVARYDVQDSALTPIRLNDGPVVAAVFASQRWTPAARWTVSTGLRVSGAQSWGVHAEPRVWTRVFFGHDLSVSVGYARIYQFVQSARNEESPLDLVLGMDLPIAAGTGAYPVARTDQVAGEFAAGLGAHVGLLVEGYARRLSGLALVPAATRLPFADGAIPVGRGTIRGIDAGLTYRDRALDVRAQAGLLDAVRYTGTMRYRPGSDRVRVAIGAGYRLAGVGVIRLAGSLGSGRPTTVLQNDFQLDPYSALDGGGALVGSPVASADSLNASRLPTYTRMDLGFSRDWEVGGRWPARINTAITMTNVLDRRNVLGYVDAPEGLRPVFLIPRTVSLRARWVWGHSP